MPKPRDHFLPGMEKPDYQNEHTAMHDALRVADVEARIKKYWESREYIWKPDQLEQFVVGTAFELVTRASTLTPIEVQAKHAGANLALRILAKYKPDLKAIEMTGTFGMSHEDALDALESRAVAAAGDAGRLPDVCGDAPPHQNEIGFH